MSTLSSSLVFLIQTLGDLYITAVLLRFLLQVVKADFYNPISQAIVKVTSPILNPVRHIIPRLGSIDASSLILALALQLLLFYLLWAIQMPSTSIPFPSILIASIVELATKTLNIYLFSLVIIAIASWVTQGNVSPGLILLMQLTNPISSRVRKIIPPIGGLDFSLMAIFIIIYFLKNLLAALSS